MRQLEMALHVQCLMDLRKTLQFISVVPAVQEHQLADGNEVDAGVSATHVIRADHAAEAAAQAASAPGTWHDVSAEPADESADLSPDTCSDSELESKMLQEYLSDKYRLHLQQWAM